MKKQKEVGLMKKQGSMRRAAVAPAGAVFITTKDLCPHVRARSVLLSKQGLFLFVSTLACLILSCYKLADLELSDRSDARIAALLQLQPYAYFLEQQLRLSLSAAYAFRVLLEVDDSLVVLRGFNVIAENMFATFNGISNLQLSPNGVITYVYPLAGNERAMGVNLFDPSNAQRRNISLQTVYNRVGTFEGPTTLLQGGDAVIARVPIFTSNANSSFLGPIKNDRQHFFWGFATMIAKIEVLLSAAGFDRLNSTGLQWQLMNQRTKQIFAASPASLLQDRLLDFESVPVRHGPASNPDISWELQFAPVGGWPQFGSIFAVQTVFAVATIIVGFYCSYNLAFQEELLSEINKAITGFDPADGTVKLTIKSVASRERLRSTTVDIMPVEGPSEQRRLQPARVFSVALPAAPLVL